eukprot:15677-Prymnesium_polylepis.2
MLRPSWLQGSSVANEPLRVHLQQAHTAQPMREHVVERQDNGCERCRISRKCASQLSGLADQHRTRRSISKSITNVH